MSVELISEPSYPVARKQHTCDWHPYQGHDIEPGEVYERQSLVNDGGMMSWKSCAYHQAAAAAVFDYWNMDVLTAEELSEALYEWWGDAERHRDHGDAYPMPFDAHKSFQRRTPAYRKATNE